MNKTMNRHGIKLIFLGYIVVLYAIFRIGVSINNGYLEQILSILYAAFFCWMSWFVFTKKQTMTVRVAFVRFGLWVASLVVLLVVIL